ncbi:MAG: hypothetical protein QGI11_11595, partial [Nitrospinota bacterium]|nr:hypothetical protein [Nitrospinota bacterium]
RVYDASCSSESPRIGRSHRKNTENTPTQHGPVLRGKIRLGTEPKLMLVDEPTDGLMPAYVETIQNVMVEIQNKGIAILLVKQNFRMALTITNRAYLIEKGVICWEGKSADLLEDQETRMRYLGV